MMFQAKKSGRIAILLLLAACADGRDPQEPLPLAPAANHSSGRDEFEDGPDLRDLRHIARYRVTAPRSMLVREWIGPDGGRLRAADFEIIVPRGAVDRMTQFRIRLPSSNGNAMHHAFAEFDASRPFLKPVTIRLPRARTNAGRGAPILWWNKDHWVPLPTKPVSDGRIQTTTTHFSFYGTGFYKGITTLGG
jgi:hypothetical protein